jgi:hypothetical protein
MRARAWACPTRFPKRRTRWNIAATGSYAARRTPLFGVCVSGLRLCEPVNVNDEDKVLSAEMLTRYL